MISLIDNIPEIKEPNAEYLRIKCLFDCYKSDKDTLFWVQDGERAYISLSRGDMTVYNNGADLEELKGFVSVISPRSIFSDIKTLEFLRLGETEIVNVFCRFADVTEKHRSDELSSKEIYEILSIPDFSLPDYPDFAVDYCRRLNRGLANYFALKEKCAAVSFHSGEFAILNGIVSREKGMGSVALRAILQKNYGRQLIACCTDDNIKFYEKNGFKQLYKAGYQWKKQT